MLSGKGFINTLALDVIQVRDSQIFFYLAEVNTVPCMCSRSRRFGQRVAGLIVYTYRKTTTDAYSQYFVNDIEHTENNERVKCENYHLFLLNKLLSALVI